MPGADMTGKMTKAERDDLVRLVKQREKVAKSAAEQRSAMMLADFERKISEIHAFDRNDVWQAAMQAGIDEAQKVNAAIAAEAAKLGIPPEFRPSVQLHWASRGENEYRQRRAELRRVAETEILAMEKTARVQIEARSIEAQTEIIANGLDSEAAIAFLEKLPPIETMMPALDPMLIQKKLAERARQDGRTPYLVPDP
jgi:hypothetical protein